MMKEEVQSSGDLFMIEEIDAENNVLILADYIFNKKSEVTVSEEQIKYYSEIFDQALLNNLFLFVEFDEKRGVIVG
ncbi:DUF5511 family protein [Heyndrickxia sporothermodurans]|uniref:DUF5511 family protein n=1 Tax=Heyndrickxia sporothermodurans TaxID=46224 RepID=UPI0035E33F1D